MQTEHEGTKYTNGLGTTASSTLTARVHQVPQSYSPIASTLPGPWGNVSHSKARNQQI